MILRALLASAENPCMGGLQWVSDPLFLGRSNTLAMKCEPRRPSTAFSWPTHPYLLLSRENGRRGHFRAFPGVSLALLQNFSWAYLGLG